jgi:flavin-dependent dehydrogenase
VRDRYDVVVAGGGPGGSTIASRLALLGRSVLVVEREAFPRFHVGESLLPMSLEVFDAIGVTPKLDARLLRKYGARFIRHDGADEVAFEFADALRAEHGYAFQGPRADIDAILLDHAAALGADVAERCEAVRAFEQEGKVSGLVVRGPEGEERTVRASVVIDATGRDGLLRRGAGCRRKVPGLERTFAIFTQMDGCARLAGDAEGDVRIVLVEAGWFWVIPFRGDRGSVGIALHPDRLARGAGGQPDLDRTLFDRIADSAPMSAVVEGARQVFERAMRLASDTYVGAVQAFYRGDLVESLFATRKRAFLRKIVTSLLAGDVFHDEVPRWLAMLRERFPATLG